MKKRIMSIALAIVLVLTLAVLPSCRRNPEDYTEKEHIERISKRVQKKYMTKDSEYTGFEVYPVYDENEDIKYFIVELEPTGYFFVELHKDRTILGCYNSLIGGSMYYKSRTPTDFWRAMLLNDEGEIKSYESPEVNVDLAPMHEETPYYEWHGKDARRYVFEVSYKGQKGGIGKIPTVKKDGQFVNAITGDKLDINNEEKFERQVFIRINFVGDPSFQL